MSKTNPHFQNLSRKILNRRNTNREKESFNFPPIRLRSISTPQARVQVELNDTRCASSPFPPLGRSVRAPGPDAADAIRAAVRIGISSAVSSNGTEDRN
ncbi:hypothetical protein TNCV_4604361 [Trichonephila clavipes]|nr:hypothetical protein TNCV_4604361 [Trichonephila clavipes]